MEAATASDPLFAFWQTTKDEAARIIKERNDLVSCVCSACVLTCVRVRSIIPFTDMRFSPSMLAMGA